MVGTLTDLLMAAPIAAEDYALRGVFPWLDGINDWISSSWLGAPLPIWKALLFGGIVVWNLYSGIRNQDRAIANLHDRISRLEGYDSRL